MAIEFQCPSCQGTLRLKEKFAGQRGSCKHCGGEIVVPNAGAREDLELSLLDDAPQQAPPATPRPAARAIPTPGDTNNSHKSGQPRASAPSAASATASDDGLIRFTCEQCDKSVKAPVAAAGRVVACPRCANRLRVPGAPLPRVSAQPLQPIARSSTSPAARPAAAAVRRPQPGGLELLPDRDGLELLPDAGGLSDALDDNIALAPAASPLQPLSASRPMTPAKKKRKSEASIFQQPAMQALGGVLTTVVVLAGIGFKLYRRVIIPVMNQQANSTQVAQNNFASTPPLNPAAQPPSVINASAPPTPFAPSETTASPPINTSAPPPPIVPNAVVPPAAPAPSPMLTDAQNAADMFDQNLQMALQIVDDNTAKRLADAWALHFVDCVEAVERMAQYKGRIVAISEKQAFEGLGHRIQGQANQIEAHVIRLANNPDTQATLGVAFERAILARPNSAFAKQVMSQANSGGGMTGIARARARAAESRARMDAQMEDMKARSKAQRDSIRNRHMQGRK